MRCRMMRPHNRADTPRVGAGPGAGPRGGPDAGIGALRRTLGIANKRGLHARAAAKFVRTAGQFDAVVRVGFKVTK